MGLNAFREVFLPRSFRAAQLRVEPQTGATTKMRVKAHRRSTEGASEGAMRKFTMLVSLCVCALVALCLQQAHAQNAVYEFNCLAAQSGSTCLDGTSTPLRNYAPSSGAAKYVSVAGYFGAGDGGEGEFVRLGNQPAVCISGNYLGTFSAGSNKVIFTSFPTGLTIGEAVSGTSIPPGAQIAYLQPLGLNPYFLMTLAATSNGSSETISGDNNGTLILDSEIPNKGCYQKTNYRGDPHEWGALGNGLTNTTEDDTPALVDWLGAPGPWDATLPATYEVTSQITCWPNINIRAPAVDWANSPSGAPVTIQAKSSSGTAWGTPQGMILMQSQCRISGLSMDANNVTYGSGTILNTIALAPAAVRPVIDSHATVLNGFHNLYCPAVSMAPSGLGLRISDSTFQSSYDNDIELDGCSNVKISNILLSGAGSLNMSANSAIGIEFQKWADFNLWNSTIQQSQGPGLQLDNVSGTPDLGSIVGNFFDSNGEGTSGGAGIELNGAAHFSICGNHFNRNDNSTSSTNTAHIRVGNVGVTNAIVFCGNDYRVDTQGSGNVPRYVYDLTGGGSLASTSLYESPVTQTAGVFSPYFVSNALPFLQLSPGFPNSYLTGLTLSNDATTVTQVDFAPGQAADSTNSTIISLAQPTPGVSPCTVNLSGTNGLQGLDVGSAQKNTTYFFFLVSQPGGANPNCMASASLTPSFAHASGYSLFRMVGALYTKHDLPVAMIPFVQNDDTFTLVTPFQFTASLSGTSNDSVPFASVPSLISVDAFGRCAAGVAVTLAAGNLNAQAPGVPFGTSPGYMIKASAPDTSFPFSLYTAGATGTPPLAPSGSLNAYAASSITLTCYNDGWIWHRGR